MKKMFVWTRGLQFQIMHVPDFEIVRSVLVGHISCSGPYLRKCHLRTHLTLEPDIVM